MVLGQTHRIVTTVMLVPLAGLLFAGGLVAGAGGPQKDGQIQRGTRAAVVADPALIDEITAAIRLCVTCLNSGDDFRLYGILTDAYLRTILSSDGFLVDDDAELDSKATPTTIRWGYLYPVRRLLAVTALADGRVAADIVFSRPEGETRKTLIWIDLGGRWLIDEETVGGDKEPKPREVEDFQA